MEIETNIPLSGNETNALQSLWGVGERKRRATAAAHIGPGYRKQEIYTPECIRDALLRVWPHIALDPCAGPGSIMGALDTYYVAPTVITTPTGREKVLYVAAEGEEDGLKLPWRDYTYVNPPYNVLKAWIKKMAWEGEQRGEQREIAGLVPWRGHRKWFRDGIANCTSIIDLDPLKFLGYKSSFPAPLVMLYWGECKATFELAFEGLGDAR